MPLHFVVDDRVLYRHHDDLYTSVARWVLADATLAGWGTSLWLEIEMFWIGGDLAMIAGSAFLPVIKEELPEERESRFWAFALGAGAYTALLLI